MSMYSIFMDIQKTIRAVAKKTKSELPFGYRVLLFGSWAEGNARARSDIDIGILGSKPLSQRTLVHIRQKLDDLPTLHKIDIVDLSRASERFRARALKHAKQL